MKLTIDQILEKHHKYYVGKSQALRVLAEQKGWKTRTLNVKYDKSNYVGTPNVTPNQ